jgi:hypothetical protein
MRCGDLMRISKLVAVVVAALSLVAETAKAAATLTPRSEPQVEQQVEPQVQPQLQPQAQPHVQPRPHPPSPPPSQPTTGTVSIKIVKAGVIVGVGSGSGTLTYAGKTYQLTVGGISLGSIGFASVELAGTAANLRAATDIAGKYSAAGAEATLIAGRQAATLQNEKGVVLKLSGVQAGFQISLGLDGMTLTLQ